MPAMPYIEKSLAQNERLLYRAHFHWFYRVAAWALLILGVAGAIVLYEPGLEWAAAGVLTAGVILFLGIMVPIWAQQIAVTNQRLIHRRGLVGRSTEELQLRAVEEVRLEQGILGRIFGFGRVVVSGTGIEDIRLPALAEPIKLRRMIQEAMSAAAGRPATT
jgi:PH (Pleckstrin Homology) domain-containing protein